ncbi:thiamine phosphate synthase [Mangrovivirga sp. M17]|uniref:Thiamine-phosphate synthase n=1 Tax=Mangrovivirga halotolerans TaxID=2993936 RepID=A0ABT3RV84_9BACT|nr:thiamine phosphate synthase [Mangrovivirga halotolerans]MCX2745548.1 thiamine phosphate synthase [Mangrovivirga halotolerans]
MIDRLHYITQEGPNGESHAEMAYRACSSGVRWVQLRIKNSDYREVYHQAKEALQICHDHGAKLIINDYVDIACELDADGVHLGQQDEDIEVARRQLKGKIIGGTANTFDQVLSLLNNNVDYIGLGPFRFTFSKEKLSPVLGLDGYKEIISQLAKDRLNVPIIGIGGILPDDIPPLRYAGVYGIAVASLINQSSDPTGIVKEINKKLNEEISYKGQGI